MKKYIVFLLLLLSGVSFAQEKYFYLTLDINKTLSNPTWIDDVSARGVRAGYRAFITPAFSAGLDVSWTSFNQYDPTKTIERSTGAITTDYFRYAYTYSIAASGQYNFRGDDQDRFIPYLGLGLGAANNEYVLYYNVYTEREQSWAFLARPEAGVLVKIGRSIGAMATLHYDYSTSKSEKFNYDNFSTIGFQIGLILMDF
jgi:hypothetical protein